MESIEPVVKILIVDDDDVCRELLKESIQEELGVDVTLAPNGLKALEMLHSNPFDILITDLNMPGMDGLKLVSHARQIYPHILSIIVTGYGSMETAIEAIREGAYDYILKPFKIDRIAVVTRNAIEKVRILRDKTRLLKELEAAYRKLQFLEGRCGDAHGRGEGVPGEEGLESPFFLLPRHNLPLNFFEVPEEASARILTKLERLKDLRRERVIDEMEFFLLKKAIFDGLGSKKS